MAVSSIERRLSGLAWAYTQRGAKLDRKDRHIASVLAAQPSLDSDGLDALLRQAARLQNGQDVPVAHASVGEVAIIGPDGRAEGLGQVADDGRLKPQRMFRRADANDTGA